MFTWFVDDEVGHLVNPTLTLSEDTQDGPEGCLSIPGLVHRLPPGPLGGGGRLRHARRAARRRGQRQAGPGDPARDDDLDGVLFLDRLDREARRTAMKEIRRPTGSPLEQPTVRLSPHATGRAGLDEGRLRGDPRPRSRASTRSRTRATTSSRVVTRPDAPAGRGRRLTPSPVALRADELGVPVLKPEHPRDPEFQDALRALTPDCCPVVAYGALLPESALDIPRHGWVNLHFSCLPAWRGAAPVQHALWAGDEVTGATTFRIVRELDAGPTFGVMTERIRPTDTAGDLLARLAEGGAGLLRRHPRRHRGRLAGGPRAARRRAVARPQDHRRRRARVAGGARRAGRPPDPGLHAGAGCWTTFGDGRAAGQARAGRTDRRGAAAGGAADRQVRGAGRDRDHRGPAGATSRPSARGRCRPRTGPAACGAEGMRRFG